MWFVLGAFDARFAVTLLAGAGIPLLAYLLKVYPSSPLQFETAQTAQIV